VNRALAANGGVISSGDKDGEETAFPVCSLDLSLSNDGNSAGAGKPSLNAGDLAGDLPVPAFA
jgi:hypothetical protein